MHCAINADLNEKSDLRLERIRRDRLNENTSNQERPLTVTRGSLIYVTGYLVLGGIGLLGWSRGTTEFLSSSVEYSDLLLRVTGLAMLCLGLVLAQIIRRKMEPLYFWTLPASGVLLICMILIYVFVLGCGRSYS